MRTQCGHEIPRCASPLKSLCKLSFLKGFWSRRADSNRRPADYELVSAGFQGRPLTYTVQGVGAAPDSTDVHPASGRPPPLLSRLLSKLPSEAGSRAVPGLLTETHSGRLTPARCGGTRVAALLYSLIESAKLAGVEPRAYLGEAARCAIRSPGPRRSPATSISRNRSDVDQRHPTVGRWREPLLIGISPGETDR